MMQSFSNLCNNFRSYLRWAKRKEKMKNLFLSFYLIWREVMISDDAHNVKNVFMKKKLTFRIPILTKKYVRFDTDTNFHVLSEYELYIFVTIVCILSKRSHIIFPIQCLNTRNVPIWWLINCTYVIFWNRLKTFVFMTKIIYISYLLHFKIHIFSYCLCFLYFINVL